MVKHHTEKLTKKLKNLDLGVVYNEVFFLKFTSTDDTFWPGLFCVSDDVPLERLKFKVSDSLKTALQKQTQCITANHGTGLHSLLVS